MHAFIEKQESINSQNAQTLVDLKDILAKFSSALSIQEKGKFPSQPQPNPKGQHNSSASSSGNQHIDQVKSVITLRSGKVVEKHILEPQENDELISEGKESVEPLPSEENTKSTPAPPFPHALRNVKKLNHNLKIFEIFNR